MAARKQTAHMILIKVSLSCFQCLAGFAEFFFPYGSNYGLSLTTKLHVIELLFVIFLFYYGCFFSFQCW